MPNPTQENWTREKIEEFLERERPSRQKIALPFGLSTTGENRGGIADLVFPKSLAGKTVLDVGCDLGFFCLEAVKRGAAKVIGVDIDADRLEQARAIAGMLGAPVEYRFLDIEKSDPPEPCDYVLLLNVLHQTRNPIGALDRLVRGARERLVLEVAGPEHPQASQILKKHSARWLARRALSRLPVAILGRGRNPGHRDDREFYFSSLAVRHLLTERRQVFARIEEQRLPFKKRRLLTAHRRRIGRMVMVAGTTGSGKSTLIEDLIAGKRPEIAAACGMEHPNEWTPSSRRLVVKDGRLRYERMLYHYDTLNPWGRDARTHERDADLDILDCCEEPLCVITCLAERRAVIERLRRECAERSEANVPRLQEVIRLYEDPARLAAQLEGWISYCAARNAKTLFVNTTAEPVLVDLESWKHLAL